MGTNGLIWFLSPFDFLKVLLLEKKSIYKTTSPNSFLDVVEFSCWNFLSAKTVSRFFLNFKESKKTASNYFIIFKSAFGSHSILRKENSGWGPVLSLELYLVPPKGKCKIDIKIVCRKNIDVQVSYLAVSFNTEMKNGRKVQILHTFFSSN